MNLRSIDSLPDLHGKRVLLRADHNVTYDEKGILKDDRKLRVTVPTIEALLRKGAALIIATHIGRPKGAVVEHLRTRPVAEHLRSLTSAIKTLTIADEVIGDVVSAQAAALKSGEVLYLENIRFHPGEEGNDPRFIRSLASLADVYVNEAFPSLHAYEEASTCGVARALPAYAGYHLLKEVRHLESIHEDPRRPLVVILSGAKMKTKIPVIQRFLSAADHILLGGCIANTFIAARGFDIGASRYEEDHMELAREIMLMSESDDMATIHIPRDAVVASGELTSASETIDLPLEDVEGDMAIYDIGSITASHYCEVIAQAGMIVWNGPLGLYEVEQCAGGTKHVAACVALATQKGSFSVIGGGDTLDFHTRYGYDVDAYSFVSTGGGAMLEFLASDAPLPALKALEE